MKLFNNTWKYKRFGVVREDGICEILHYDVAKIFDLILLLVYYTILIQNVNNKMAIFARKIIVVEIANMVRCDD